MKPKTKKTKSRRSHHPRTTYDVTLEHASARLEKAQNERTDCLMKLDLLSRQIPWLENLVQAVTPAPEQPLGGALGVGPSQHSPGAVVTAAEIAAKEAAWKAQNAPEPEPVPAADQEAFLARFTPPTGRITTSAPPVHPQPSGNSADPDEFLQDLS
jgi:hypothetical protein